LTRVLAKTCKSCESVQSLIDIERKKLEVSALEKDFKTRFTALLDLIQEFLDSTLDCKLLEKLSDMGIYPVRLKTDSVNERLFLRLIGGSETSPRSPGGSSRSRLKRETQGTFRGSSRVSEDSQESLPPETE